MFTKIKKEKKYNKERGFSLVELLIYTAGMVILISVLMLMVVKIYGVYKQTTLGPRADRTGLIILDRILKDIRSGQSINLGQSFLGVPDGKVRIVTTENSSRIYKVYFLNGGRVYYQEWTEDVLLWPLSPSDMKVTKLQFEYLTTGISEGVRVEIDITFNNGDELVTKEYDGFAILRQ